MGTGMGIVIFAIVVLMLLGGLYLAWSLWWSYVEVNPEDEAFHNRVAHLNDDQSYRMSDQQIANPPDSETAWMQMVRQGRRRRRTSRSSRLR